MTNHVEVPETLKEVSDRFDKAERALRVVFDLMGEVGDSSVAPPEGEINAETAQNISKLGIDALNDLYYSFLHVMELLESSVKQEVQS